MRIPATISGVRLALIGVLLLAVSCSSDPETVASPDASTPSAGEADPTTSIDTAPAIAMLPGQAEFIAGAEKACRETQEAIDGLLAESSDPGLNPQPTVQGIAQHFRELFDHVSAIENLEPEVRESTEFYLSAVLEAAEEAEEANSSPETAASYMAAHSAKLDAVNKAGRVLGVEACRIEFEAGA